METTEVLECTHCLGCGCRVVTGKGSGKALTNGVRVKEGRHLSWLRPSSVLWLIKVRAAEFLRGGSFSRAFLSHDCGRLLQVVSSVFLRGKSDPPKLYLHAGPESLGRHKVQCLFSIMYV
jgi:hypothetical protein